MLDQSYATTSFSTGYSFLSRQGSPTSWAGETFTAGITGVLGSIDLPIWRDPGYATGLTLQVFAFNGNNLGALLGSVTLASSLVPTGEGNGSAFPPHGADPFALHVDLSLLGISLVAGQTYALAASATALYPSDLDGNGIIWYGSPGVGVDHYAGGHEFFAYSASLGAGTVLSDFGAAADLGFRTYVTPPSYTIAGTQGIDYLVPAAGNQYLGGAGNDVYLVNAYTLNTAVTATIVDTEGTNVIQLTDGSVIAASQFFSNAVQLTLSTGAVVQVLGAAAFQFQIGANAIAGDGRAPVSYANFADALGVSLPITGSVSGTANYLVPSSFTPAAPTTPAVAGITSNVPGTLGNDFLVVSAGDTYFGGNGDDSYLVGGNTFSGNVTAQILDVEGSNTIQLVDGTLIASSRFLNDAVELTLSTGAKLQIPGASKLTYQVGANITAGDTATPLSYLHFSVLLGGTIPGAGAAPVNGTPNYLVGSSLVPEQIDLHDGIVTATAAAEVFRYDFQILRGRATTAGDLDVTINGFDPLKDKLVFVNTSSSASFTEAQFKALNGVVISENPFGNNTTIVFDPNGSVVGGVILNGIVDAPLNTIVVEAIGS